MIIFQHTIWSIYFPPYFVVPTVHVLQFLYMFVMICAKLNSSTDESLLCTGGYVHDYVEEGEVYR